MLKEPLTVQQVLDQIDLAPEIVDNWDDVPFIPDIDKQIYTRITACPKSFKMSMWHGKYDEDGELWDFNDEITPAVYECGTAHCLAGWACVLSGVATMELEKNTSTEELAFAIFMKSTGTIPDFYAGNKEALEELRERASAFRKE